MARRYKPLDMAICEGGHVKKDISFCNLCFVKMS